jgi:hypothetical protein
LNSIFERARLSGLQIAYLSLRTRDNTTATVEPSAANNPKATSIPISELSKKKGGDNRK